MKKYILLLFHIIYLNIVGFSQSKNAVIYDKSPSVSYYFDWINSEWPGSHHQKILANLEFFQWMKDEYDMQLDLYLMDAGNLDQSPHWVEGAVSREEGLQYAYGSVEGERFRRKFPDGIEPLFEKAAYMNTNMGIWLGPDGYGETEQDALARQNMIVDFSRKYNFGIFKFDRACTDLRPEKEKYFIQTMKKCREYTPDLITIGHRITFSPEAESYMTTELWGDPKETYVDVHTWNNVPAIHHRVGNLARGLPPGLNRMVEDHGVCLSSCLDYWEDDIVMQAFARNLILSPEIYGSPWFLRDAEFPKLGRLFNLHRQYRNILVNGFQLPENEYGQYAVSRGDDKIRLVSLANLGWEPEKRVLNLTEELGLKAGEKILVKQYHPTEKIIGEYNYGDRAEVTVEPFRMGLFLISTELQDDVYLKGTDYEVIRNIPGEPIEVRLMGMPGQNTQVQLINGEKYTKATLDGKSTPELLKNNMVSVQFPGVPLNKSLHRKLANFSPVKVPKDALVLYEATCFAADNNALEVRSLERSGPSKHKVVQEAREEFFTDPTFVNKGIWDKYAWDEDDQTYFKVRDYRIKEVAVEPGAFRFNLGTIIKDAAIVIKGIESGYNPGIIEYSKDRKNWIKISSNFEDSELKIERIPALQYLRITNTPLQISEISVASGNQKVQPDNWRASNLFKSHNNDNFKSALMASFELNEIPENSYLVVSIPGEYGNEAAFAGIKAGKEYVGAPDRAPSFESNHWEHVVVDVNGNYAYYFPIKKEYLNKKIEAYVLGFNKEVQKSAAKIYITAYPKSYKEKFLRLE